jgi:hypothetical protein
VSPLVDSSWGRFFEGFHCRSCGGAEAYRSRPRGFFEKYVLPLFLLQTVRCERCYHRGYASRTVPLLERVEPAPKSAKSQAPPSSNSDSRVA